MDKNFTCIKGSIQKGRPANIYFYSDIEDWCAENFIYELQYLEQEIKPSIINIHINSSGGSCASGVQIFSLIMDCKTPIACYNDGLAASMASIIWAAGGERYMKDYSLLMIHNPFIDRSGDKVYNQVTDAFKQQLRTIYQKRFGFSEEEIENIMNGEDGNDGTWFTAEEAVKRGFLDKKNIIETTPAARMKVSNAMTGSFNIADIKNVMSSISAFNVTPETTNGEFNNNSTNNTKMEKEEIRVIATLLGFSEDKVNLAGISAQINALKSKAEKFDVLNVQMGNMQKKLETTEANLKGANASIKNLQTNLKEAQDALEKYKTAEQEAQTAKVNALVDEAIASCKIEAEDKATWVKMAENDFELAKSVLDKIPARQQLSNAIAETNATEAKTGTMTEEEKTFARVKEVVGDSFKFRTIE